MFQQISGKRSQIGNMAHISPAAMHLSFVGRKHGIYYFWNSMDEALADKPGTEIVNMPAGLSFALGGDVKIKEKHIGYFVTLEDVIRWVDKINNGI